MKRKCDSPILESPHNPQVELKTLQAELEHIMRRYEQGTSEDKAALMRSAQQVKRDMARNEKLARAGGSQKCGI